MVFGRDVGWLASQCRKSISGTAAKAGSASAGKAR